jgi:hypothetical protein
MTELPLRQRVARTAGERWGCLFIGMHLALKGWLRRKQSVWILVGPQAADTWRWAVMPWVLGSDLHA